MIHWFEYAAFTLCHWSSISVNQIIQCCGGKRLKITELGMSWTRHSLLLIMVTRVMFASRSWLIMIPRLRCVMMVMVIKCCRHDTGYSEKGVIGMCVWLWKKKEEGEVLKRKEKSISCRSFFFPLSLRVGAWCEWVGSGVGRISAHLVYLTGQQLAKKKSTSPKGNLAVAVVESWYTTTTFFFCTHIHTRMQLQYTLQTHTSADGSCYYAIVWMKHARIGDDKEKSERARCTLGNHEMEAVFGALHDVWDELKTSITARFWTCTQHTHYIVFYSFLTHSISPNIISWWTYNTLHVAPHCGLFWSPSDILSFF